jgi:hypothetical protein
MSEMRASLRHSIVVACCVNLVVTPLVYAQAAAPPQPPAAASRAITLDDALALAEEKSEQVMIARAGVERAQGDELRARSELFPQISASAAYDRALASEFEGIFDVTGPSCTPLTVNPAAPLGDRVAEIERALQDCPPTGEFFGGGGGTGNGDGGTEEDAEIPFGQPNTVRSPFSSRRTSTRADASVRSAPARSSPAPMPI